MTKFYEIEPTLENYWRAIILFGRNTASYKFALAKALYDLPASGTTLLTLVVLAIPYANHLCERLKTHPRQGTSNQSAFLDYLRSFNEGAIRYEEMISHTVRYGFNNVIDAFHNVHGQEIVPVFSLMREIIVVVFSLPTIFSCLVASFNS